MTNKINLIFDFDGTLFNSYDSVGEWVLKCCEKLHVKTTKEEIIKLCLLRDGKYAMDTILERNKTNKLLFLLTCAFTKMNLDSIKLYPHAKEVLSNEKFNCFIYTHRGKTAKPLIEKFDLKKYIIETVDATYHFKRKPNSQGVDYLIKKYKLNKSNTYYVGDRLIDIECGLNAGIKTIFYNSAKLNIDSSKATYKINDLKEINELKL